MLAMAEEAKAPSRWQERRNQRANMYATSTENAAILQVRRKKRGQTYVTALWCVDRVVHDSANRLSQCHTPKCPAVGGIGWEVCLVFIALYVAPTLMPVCACCRQLRAQLNSGATNYDASNAQCGRCLQRGHWTFQVTYFCLILPPCINPYVWVLHLMERYPA